MLTFMCLYWSFQFERFILNYLLILMFFGGGERGEGYED